VDVRPCRKFLGTGAGHRGGAGFLVSAPPQKFEWNWHPRRSRHPATEHADTLNEARERASFKARALGWPNYFELDTGENDDGQHLCAGGQTEFVAQPL
jgi:hypothetical protein